MATDIASCVNCGYPVGVEAEGEEVVCAWCGEKMEAIASEAGPATGLAPFNIVLVITVAAVVGLGIVLSKVAGGK